jgi:hypothetical protein
MVISEVRVIVTPLNFSNASITRTRRDGDTTNVAMGTHRLPTVTVQAGLRWAGLKFWRAFRRVSLTGQADLTEASVSAPHLAALYRLDSPETGAMLDLSATAGLARGLPLASSAQNTRESSGQVGQ